MVPGSYQHGSYHAAQKYPLIHKALFVASCTLLIFMNMISYQWQYQQCLLYRQSSAYAASAYSDWTLSQLDSLPLHPSPCPVTPEVQVTATRTRIQLGGTVTLTCTVTRSNPSGNYMYTWTLLPAMAVSGPTASTQSTDILAVMFDMEDDYGTYRCSVQNNAGLIGTADIVIEQGCKSNQLCHKVVAL